MTQENKQLLLQDLCARLAYGIYANLPNHHLVSHEYYIREINVKNEWTNGILHCAGRKQFYGAKIEDIKPYLRSMSSMTEEEYVYFMSIRGMNLRSYEIQEMMSENFSHPNRIAIVNTLGRYSHKIDWLNKNMFDYRGLIEKGLAIEVTKENNPYKD